MDLYFNDVTTYILVVDDDNDDQYFLRNAINKVIPNVIIESLYDGSEAIDFLRNCKAFPNLIFLDLNMAKVNGKTTMKAIKQNSSLEKVPVIILTTSRNENERDELLKMGASAFYTKPSNAAELVNLITEVKNKWLA
jgi:two-component system response regulator